MSIGSEQLKRRFIELLQASGEEGIGPAIGEFAKYIGEHITDLTPEAEEIVEKFWAVLKPEVDAAVQRLPDTPEGRQIKRLFARTEGKHWDAEGLVRGLEASVDPKHPVVGAARPLFLRHFQVYLDLLWDVAQHTHEGPADVVRMVMFALAADELLVAFHTGQRGYASQAYAHVRTVFEAMNLVELFTRRPEEADVWVSADNKTKYHEFRPIAVRMKLHEKRWDPIYGWLSEQGTHVTWDTIRNRAAFSRSRRSDEPGQIGLWVGGAPFVHNYMFATYLCLHALVMVMFKLAAVFNRYMNIKEAKELLRSASADLTQFVLDHYVPWAKGENLQTADIETFIREQVPAQLKALMSIPD